MTEENKLEFVLRCLYALGHESDEQLAAFKRGFNSVLDLSYVQMFNGEGLERLACGSQDMDLAFLRSKTQVSGFDDDERMKDWFFQTLEQFSPEDRRLFLAFSWGRSRLPPVLDNEFRIEGQSHSDTDLPAAHTW